MIVYKIKKEWKKYIKERSGNSGCYVSATPNVPSVSLDGDALKMNDVFKSISARSGQSGDCILIEHDGATHVGVIEFKSRQTDGTRAAKQVLAGYSIAKILLAHHKFHKKIKVYLIVSSCGHSASVRAKFFDEIRRSGEDIENAIVAGCHEKFKDLRKRKRDF